MGERNMNCYFDGTSALKMPRFAATKDETRIIEFPGKRPMHRQGGVQPRQQNNDAHRRVGRVVKDALDSSEMYCSLRFEDFRGCAYDLFTNKGIAALATGSAFIGIVSLILGA